MNGFIWTLGNFLRCALDLAGIGPDATSARFAETFSWLCTLLGPVAIGRLVQEGIGTTSRVSRTFFAFTIGVGFFNLVLFVRAIQALAAFDANAVAYLLKPVVQERLRAVVSRVEQLVGSAGEVAVEAARTSAIANARPQPLHHVLAVQREGYVLIPLSDVCFFQVEDGVTYVKTATSSYRTNYAIGNLESRLPTPPFFRAHRGTIANLDKVATVNPMFKGSMVLTMNDSRRSEIQVSERQAKTVRELLQI